MTLHILIYQRDDYDKMVFRADGIQDELGKSTDDGVKFRVAVQFSVLILTNPKVEITSYNLYFSKMSRQRTEW
jgi:hypothetical protein